MAEFFWNYIWPLIIMVAESLLRLVILLIAIDYVLYADRKSLNLSAIVEAQRDHGVASWLGVPWLTIFNWYRLPLLPMFLIFFVSALADDLVESRGQQRAGGGAGEVRRWTVYHAQWHCSAPARNRTGRRRHGLADARRLPQAGQSLRAPGRFSLRPEA